MMSNNVERRSRPPGDRASRRHGRLQREQGRSRPPDPHPGYRAAPARDPGERGRAAAARHPRQPGHVPGRGDGARGRAGGDRRLDRIPGQRRRRTGQRSDTPRVRRLRRLTRRDALAAPARSRSFGNHQVGGRLVHAFLHNVSHCTHQGQLGDPLRLMIVGRPSVPSVPGQRLHCQRRANHPDPVTTSHLAGGEPGPVAKARTTARGRAPRSQGDTVTSPAAGAGSAADLPDYAPIPRSALGPALNDHKYYVGRVQRNLYWVTDGVYQSAFLTTPDGVVLFDAPPSIGNNLRLAVDEITAANGVTNRVTHLVYSHHHADHAGASSLFDGDVVRIGHEETRRLLERDNDPARPLPEVTFADTYTLEVGGERAELAWHGPNHSPDNIYIHFPGHDTLMFIDVVNAGWVPIYNVNLSEDVPRHR